ncbi:MAG TPA: SpoIIE family protein phosphatase [Candidatus Polarisedimenticolia bacterium]|nr:SpoIIE family protein phosphatase [Candidatus Polarisedimenticolia bacterium]
MIDAFLVDDEEPARERLRRLLSELDGIRVVGEAADGEEALREIPRHRPDLVFLDIQMPGRSGMEVASALPPPRPRVIFCTAFDQYAIQAFEHHAVDYLLKPLNRERLAAAVGRVRDSLETTGRMARELASASEAQARLYPDLVRLETLEVSGSCRSSREVGGDYYDFLPLGRGRLGIAVGDVSGKGIFAGLLMAGLQGRLQTMAVRYGDDLPALFSELNRAMHASTDANRYATLFYGVYEEPSRRLTYVNAGHPAPLLLRRAAGGAPGWDPPEALAPTGTVVGLLPEARYEARSLHLCPGDLLLAFSDGLVEAGGEEGPEFGPAALADSVRGLQEAGAAAIRERILEEERRFRSDRKGEDDLTLVVARVR